MTSDEIKALADAATPGVWGKAEDEDGVFIEVYDSYYIAEMVNGLKAEMLEANAALIPALVNAYRAGLLVHRDDVPTWQPIETAPKDGIFLAYEGGYYYGCSVYENHPGEPVSYSSHCGQYVTEPPEPTHWMPIPAAPKEQGE